MEVFWKNFEYISLNTFLAVIPVVFGLLMIKFRFEILKFIFGFIWLIFLPNTIYILTDISHLFEAWPKVDSLSKLLLILQYSVFSIVGIVTFVISVYFFQKMIEGNGRKIKLTSLSSIVVIILNFIVGLGVILGGIQRTNSWDILINPSRVIKDVNTLVSSQELLVLSFGIGLLANFIYFVMLETVATWGKKYLKK